MIPPRIVVVGSINMDLMVKCSHLPARGETIIASSSREVPGGKGANQAVAAVRAGGSVAMIGRVGDDAFADRLVDNLRREEIAISTVERTQASASGIAVVAVEDSGDNSIMVIPGANGGVTPEDIKRQTKVIRAADVVLLQLEIPVESVVAASRIAKDAGVLTILDPAPTPSVFPRELFDVDVICPNQSEASQLVGAPVNSVDDAMKGLSQLRDRGTRSAIITMADQGSVVDNGSQMQWISPFSVSPVDTTAAGDAFAGALAVRLALDDGLFEAARYASAAGALATTVSGAQPSMPTRDQVESFLTHHLP